MAYTSTTNDNGSVTITIDTGAPYDFISWLDSNITDPEDLADFKSIQQAVIAEQTQLIADGKLTVTTSGTQTSWTYASEADTTRALIESFADHPKQESFRLARMEYHYMPGGVRPDVITLKPF
jgi:hypothetical protein